MAKKKESAEILSVDDGKTLVARTEEATRLTTEARNLTDVAGSNLVAVGLIIRKFRNNPGLHKALNFPSRDQWMKSTFEGKLTTAKTSDKIVSAMLSTFGENELLKIGRVKCVAFSRLPESEQLKATWKEWVRSEDSTTFKERVKAFIGGKDHREGFGTVSFPAPKSFIEETFNRVISKGKIAEETTDTFLVIESALASYEQDLPDTIADNDMGASCTTLIKSTRASRAAIKEALEVASNQTGESDDITVLAALNTFIK